MIKLFERKQILTLRVHSHESSQYKESDGRNQTPKRFRQNTSCMQEHEQSSSKHAKIRLKMVHMRWQGRISRDNILCCEHESRTTHTKDCSSKDASWCWTNEFGASQVKGTEKEIQSSEDEERGGKEVASERTHFDFRESTKRVSSSQRKVFLLEDAKKAPTNKLIVSKSDER